jgi:NDP-sugar pyrophosphorylase family protein
MAVVPNTEPHKYGGASVQADGVVTGFVKRGSREPSYHFVGVQAAEAGAFEGVRDDVPSESVASLYPALMARQPGAVRAFVSSAEFFDIGTPADYLSTSLLLHEREGSPLHGAGARIHAGARVERSVLWDDVEVGEGSFVKECVVTDGVRVPADTSWTGVTLRRANGELAPGERPVEGLAVCSL